MSDKVQLIKEEILRRKQSWQHSDKQYEHGGKDVCDYLLGFIDSLPEEFGCEVNFTTKSEDLEEEFYRFIDEKEGIPKMCNTRECIAWGVDTACHFAEWQEKKMLGIAEAFYQQGRYEQEQEMMKDAVELHIVESFNPVGTENEKPHGFTALCYNAKYPDFYPVTGQTIKVIPTKEVQQ